MIMSDIEPILVDNHKIEDFIRYPDIKSVSSQTITNETKINSSNEEMKVIKFKNS